VINILKHADLIDTGHLAEVSSTITTKLSWFGSMKKINSESSLCNQVEISKPSLRDWKEPPTASRKLKNSPETTISDISLLAQPTVELVSEPLSMSDFHYSPKITPDSNRLLTKTTSRSEELMENTLKAKMEPMISVTREDSDSLNTIWSKTCTTESRP